MNSHLIEYNKRVYKALGVSKWHEAGITGEGVKVAVIGYGACIPEHKPYVTNMPNVLKGSYHDGDEIIHEIAPDAEIFGLNFLDKNSWKFEKCLEWCLDNNIDVICTSIRKNLWNDDCKRLSRELWDNNCIMIDSSDNEYTKNSMKYPALDPHWFCVGAFDERANDRAGYSSWGDVLDCVMYTGLAVQRAYKQWIPITHTSGATQPVAGMAALLKQTQNITPEEFKNYIRDNSIRLKSKDWEPHTGWGLFILGEVEQVNNPQYIIIHHSATAQGDAETFRRAHKAKGWRDVGYHYVIGNGTYSGDGEVETGRPENESGAHCSADGMNFKSIGICLVGNFDIDKPTIAQMEALERLCRDIMARYKIPVSKVLGHGEVAATNCPGKNFDINAFRKELVKVDKKDYEGHWAKASIEKAKASGVMSGYPDGTFKPDQHVTRAELAVILDRLGLLEVK